MHRSGYASRELQPEPLSNGIGGERTRKKKKSKGIKAIRDKDPPMTAEYFTVADAERHRKLDGCSSGPTRGTEPSTADDARSKKRSREPNANATKYGTDVRSIGWTP